MCIAIPGQVVEIAEEQGVLVGTVQFDGIARRVSLDLVREVEVGDWVLVYTGFAMARIDEAEAQELLVMHAEMAELLEVMEAVE